MIRNTVFLCITGGVVFVMWQNGMSKRIGPDNRGVIRYAITLYDPYAIVRPK